MDPYANSKVYGPYSRPDNRKHVIVIFLDGSRKTVSYPKFLVEKAIGRTLEKFEEVNHINGDFTDNRLENLEVVDKKAHAKLHARHLLKQDFLCPVCRTEFSLDGKSLSDLVRNRRQGRSKTGPFCSKSCAGIGSNERAEVKEIYITALGLQIGRSVDNAANSAESVIDDNAELD